jgi:hypothetical protein
MVSLDLSARLVRRSLRRASAQRRFPNTLIKEMPILFGNSFPKSGTHLLTQILAGFAGLGPVVESGLPPILTFEGETGRPRTLNTISADLNRLLPGDIAYGHLHATPKLVEVLCSSRFANYFIYRDPRDVVVSHVFYVTDINNRHVHHDYYVNQLKDFNQRLRTSIQGLPDLAIPFPDIRTRFEPYLPWLDRNEVLSLRYEDLLEKTTGELERILDHAVMCGFALTGNQESAIETLQRAIKPAESPTFRSGGSGGWKEHFTPELKRLFKDLTGDLLIHLGYEQNQNW